jgi:hypothetical protein
LTIYFLSRTRNESEYIIETILLKKKNNNNDNLFFILFPKKPIKIFIFYLFFFFPNTGNLPINIYKAKINISTNKNKIEKNEQNNNKSQSVTWMLSLYPIRVIYFDYTIRLWKV